LNIRKLLEQLEVYDSNDEPVYVYITDELYYPITEVKKEKNNIIIVCKDVKVKD